MPTFNIDGQSVNQANATVSVMDHGLLYGDGVFEGLRFYTESIFKCREHLVRLEDSATAIGLKLPMSFDDMTQAMEETIAASKLSNGYIRLLVTRGEGPLGIDASTCSSPKTIIIVDQLSLVPKSISEAGIKVVIASTRRLSADQLDPRVKSLNYLNNILARNEANNAGAQEAIMLNQLGRVAEGSADNVFIVHNGIVKTPPTTEGALAGITRETIIEIAQTLDISFSEQPLTSFDLVTADECFLTGTGAELIAVRQIDNTTLPTPRPVFEKLQAAFHSFVTNAR